MPTNGLALKKRAELISANIRPAYDRMAAVPATVVTPPLADVIPLVSAPPTLAHPPTTRALDDKGRVTVRLKSRGLGEVMGWPATALRAERDGAWVVLRPAPSAEGRRNDGHARLGDDGRLRLPLPLRRLVGVDTGDEVVVLALPELGVVALCHPSRLLTGAPLQLLNQAAVAAETN